jgi:16S rRNA (cytosine967-C5)-methyltransferase
LAALNREPELVFRVRPPGTRGEVVALLASEEVVAKPLPLAPDACVVDEGRRVFDSKSMRAQRLQVMDLGSQLIAELCRPVSGFTSATLVDYCAGAGGKTLSLADLVGPSGVVFAHDASKRRLDEAGRRAREWGLKNVRLSSQPPLSKASAVLIDAPCSGVGSLAREPDQKWKLTSASIDDFARKQSAILDLVAAELSPGTVLVYATCSLLRRENEAVVEAFLARHRRFERADASEVISPEAGSNGYLRLWPHRAAGGGFFAARMVCRATP